VPQRSSPPAHARFDYQIGGAYPPAAGVAIVDRDRGDRPAAGQYNVCYPNAFQAQPQETAWWRRHHPGLLLKAGHHRIVDKTSGDNRDCDFGCVSSPRRLTVSSPRRLTTVGRTELETVDEVQARLFDEVS